MLEDFKLTQTTVDFVMSLISKIVNKTVADVTSMIIDLLTAKFEENGLVIDPSLLRDVKVNVDQHNFDPFVDLKTRYFQKKYFIEKLALIPPIPIPLPVVPTALVRHRTRKPRQIKPQYMYYVPLLSQLKALLSKPDIYQYVFRPGKRHTGMQSQFLSSFEDGSVYQQSPFFKEHPNALQINLYLDEAQQCVLGSKASNAHKLMFVYFTIGNLSSLSRSNFKHIHLLGIFRNSEIKKFGLQLLMRPIVEDLKLLEKGVEMELPTGTETIFGTLVITTADNLGAHQIGGFKAGFATGFRKCRHCLATDLEIQTLFSDGEFVARTKEEHDRQCECLEIPGLAVHTAKVYGLAEKSILNELEHFHVIDGLVPDLMHDILEGSLPAILIPLIEHCIANKFFTLKELNSAILNFNYGTNEVKNKPCTIDANHLKNKKLRQSASQLWTLGLILPLLVGSLVPVDDKKWEIFTNFLEICRIIFSVSISRVQIRILESLIADFLSDFVDVFQIRLTPKMHFLLHYCRYIRMYGPLIAFWCMRYEAKHSYFKQLTRSIGNYLNLPFSLSFRHQQWQCKNLHSSQPMLSVFIATPKPKHCSLSKFKSCGAVAHMFSITDLDFPVSQFSWVKVASTCVKVDKTLLLCRLAGSDSKSFGLVKSILKVKGSYLFLCEMYHTFCFDIHLQAFKVLKRKDNLIIPVLLSDAMRDDLKPYTLHRAVHVNLRVHDVDSIFIIAKSDLMLTN